MKPSPEILTQGEGLQVYLADAGPRGAPMNTERCRGPVIRVPAYRCLASVSVDGLKSGSYWRSSILLALLTATQVKRSLAVLICVVVADSSKARILLAENGRDPLTEHREYRHPESRMKEQDLVTDGSGSGIDSGGYGKHSMGHEKTARREEAKTFANELCEEVEKLRRKTGFRRIYLVASPKFLGLLRSGMNKPCAGLLSGEVDKDLVNHSIEEISRHLPRRL